MELRQLRYFVAVAEEGNISRAAQKIFLTQSALSRQIKALEAELEKELLERQAHSVRLTAAGELLLVEARALLRQADLLQERIRTVGNGPRLRVGYAPSLSSGWLSAAIANLTQAHPTARVELFDLSTAEMLSGLEAERLEVIVTVRPTRETRGIQWTSLRQDTWLLAVPRNHPWAKRTRVALEEVSGQPLLIFCQRDYPEYWEQLSSWWPTGRPRLAGEYDGAESLMSAVEAGLGVAVVTSRMSRLFPERVRFLRLSGEPGPLCVAAGCRPERSRDPAVGVLMEEMKRAAGEESIRKAES